MASEGEDFSLSGPSYLTCINWSNAHHRTCIAASLVNGVYIMELDRQKKREESEALAPPWWDFFQFKLLMVLTDDDDDADDLSIFGAIFENNDSIIIDHIHRPRYIIAFRGTIIKADSLARDIELDVHLFLNRLHQTSRFDIAMRAVRNMVADVGNSNVWLAGHSLGSGMAMLAGKSMAKSGLFLESFLFNPPFVSAPIERIRDKRVKFWLRIAASVIKAGLAIAKEAKNQRNLSESEDPFAAISAWVPCLYVNPSDHLCSEYLGYFEHRKNMEDIGIGLIEKLATQHSLGGLLMNAVGIRAAEVSEPFHLIPSAKLVVNRIPDEDFKNAHGIHQWWSPNPDLHYEIYKYR